MPELTEEMMEADRRMELWRVRERWAWYGAVAGSLITSIFWLIVIGF